MADWAMERRRQGISIALVPTMGYFHPGHLQLMRRACELADQVVVSLFVNPIQFGPGEDLATYPADHQRDCQLAEEVGITAIFLPERQEMYPAGFASRIQVEALTDSLCGSTRPGHFAGVVTVVGKLFNIIQPDIAVFGEKDYQQLVIIRKMVRDLNWNIKIVGHPTVRELDGLAMSSRNTYLSSTERQSALCLSKAIVMARQKLLAGTCKAATLLSELSDFILSHPGVTVEYVSLVDPDTLENVAMVERGSLLAMAVKIGNTRLIDNAILA